MMDILWKASSRNLRRATLQSAFLMDINNLSFGFISLKVREIFSMHFVIFFEGNSQRPIPEKKSAKGARKDPKFQERNPKLRLKLVR